MVLDLKGVGLLDLASSKLPFIDRYTYNRLMLYHVIS
jgi:hypothetical protein